MTLEPTSPAPMHAPNLFAERVLDFTRAEAILADLTVAADNLHASLTTPLAKRDESLSEQLAELRADATKRWLKGTPGMDGGKYEHARAGAIGRVRALERRALDVAGAAGALVALLESCEHYDRPEDIIEAIEHLRRRIEDADGFSSDVDTEAPLTAMWQRITPSALVSAEACDILRRHYDANLNVQRFELLRTAVDDWRTRHLGRSLWNADTFMYAIATARDWVELADLWELIGNPEERTLTATENVHARTAIAAKVTDAGDSNTIPVSLREAVIEFNTSTHALMMRMRAAASMADLLVVSNVLTGRTRDAEGTLNLMRTHNGKYEWLIEHNAPDADPEGDRWAPAAILAERVTAWRESVYTEAVRCTGARENYTEEQRYVLMYNAIADAADTGQGDRVKSLMHHVERVERAEAHHILTAEHIANLRIIAAPKGERMVETEQAL